MAAVLYKSLRAGRDSVAVACDLGLRPPWVRQIVGRANAAAIKLGFETFAPSKTKGRHRKRIEGVRVMIAGFPLPDYPSKKKRITEFEESSALAKEGARFFSSHD